MWRDRSEITGELDAERMGRFVETHRTGPVGVIAVAAVLTAGRNLWNDLVGLRIQAWAARRESRYDAHHDALTGLFNRNGLTAVMASFGQSDAVSAIYLDLDGFTAINDTWGHRVGDLVLVEISQRLRRAIGSDAAIARIGGDEFVALLSTERCPDAVAVADAIGRVVGAPIVGHSPIPLHVTASVGIASTLATDMLALDQVIERADRAQYQAKRSRRAIDGSHTTPSGCSVGSS